MPVLIIKRFAPVTVGVAHVLSAGGSGSTKMETASALYANETSTRIAPLATGGGNEDN